MPAFRDIEGMGGQRFHGNNAYDDGGYRHDYELKHVGPHNAGHPAKDGIKHRKHGEGDAI